jgi:hypothetical protein
MTDTKKNVHDLNSKLSGFIVESMGLNQDVDEDIKESEIMSLGIVTKSTRSRALTRVKPESKNNFQIAQGGLSLSVSDSSELFRLSDAIPPDASTAYYSPDYSNMRSSSYGLLLSSLLPGNGTDLSDVLGDMYPSWIEYRDKVMSTVDENVNQQAIFEKWANRNLDSGKAQQAIVVLKKSEMLSLSKALDEYNDDSNKQIFLDSTQTPYKLYKYTATINQAKDAIANGSSIDKFSFDSSKASLGENDGNDDENSINQVFLGIAGVDLEDLNEKAASSRITIEGNIDKYQTLPTGPMGWYESSIVNMAYNNKDNNNIWDPKAQLNWNDFFAQPKGSLSRYVEQFLLISGYDLKVCIYGSFTQNDVDRIKSDSTLGIWPFFHSAGEKSDISDTRLEDGGTLSYTVKSNPGNIKIWGVVYKCM